MRELLYQDSNGKIWKATNLQAGATHRCKTDFELGRTNRPNLPMVWAFDDRRVTLTFEWQMYFVAINYGMRLNNISHMWDDNVAFCNNTGFHGDHNRRNYILMEDLNNELPQLDKTRTCGDALVLFKDVVVEVEDPGDEVFEPATYAINSMRMLCMNGTANPLLKPGKVHPANAQEALGSFERYLLNPRDNPLFFFPATTTGGDNKAHAWPEAAFYPWYGNGVKPVAWMFHVAPEGVITYPPKQFAENTPQFVEL